jgi:hypothetical protein
MGKKVIVTALFSLFILMSSFSLEVFLANLTVYPDRENVTITEEDRNITQVLYQHLLDEDFGNLLTLKLLSEKKSMVFNNPAVRSRMDASEACELLGIHYIIYGSISKTLNYYDASINLFDNDLKDSRKVIYAKVGADEFEELVEDLARKYINYLYAMLGYKDKKKLASETTFGGIAIHNALGYYFPFSSWWNITTGLFTIETGIKAITMTPLGKNRNFQFSLRPGFVVSYSMGINKPGFLESYYHVLTFKLPLDNCFELFQRHTFTIGLGPQLQVAILYQKKLFDDPYTNASVAFSLFADFGYEHWFGKHKLIAVGISNTFDFTFYSNFYVDYKAQLYVINRIPIEYQKVRRTKDET